MLFSCFSVFVFVFVFVCLMLSHLPKFQILNLIRIFGGVSINRVHTLMEDIFARGDLLSAWWPPVVAMVVSVIGSWIFDTCISTLDISPMSVLLFINLMGVYYITKNMRVDVNISYNMVD